MVKRIVLFSDVHGNITGLEAIMNEVQKLENVEYIIGLGDYFGWSEKILINCASVGQRENSKKLSITQIPMLFRLWIIVPP